MPLSEIVLIIMGLLTLAMLAAGLCQKWSIPYTVFLVVIGITLGFFAREIDALEFLLQFQLSPEIVLFLFLPALIFESGINLNARQLMKDIAPVLVLAVLALSISTAIIGAGLWLLLDVNPGLALLFGALISATDPVAVIALFRELGVPERLTVLIEGESLLNDATAIVLFNIILGLMVAGNLEWRDAGLAVVEFLRVFFGGLIVGVILGVLTGEVLHRFFRGMNAFMIMSLVIAYSSFIIAEHFIHVSGVMAVVGSSITLAYSWVNRLPQTEINFIHESWNVIVLISNSLLFLLVGISIDIGLLVTQLDLVLIAILLVLFARACTVYSLVPVSITLFSLPKISMAERHIMWWGGLKGGLAIAIVLSIPADLPGRDLVLNLTLGAVLFSLLVNAPTVRPLIRRLGIDKMNDDELSELRYALSTAKEKSANTLDLLYKNELISRVREQLIRKDTDRLFSISDTVIEKNQTERHLAIMALRTEFDALKQLYDIGMLEHYAYLDFRNNLQRDREKYLNPVENEECIEDVKRSGIFVKLEEAMIKRLREHDWSTWLLARYQNLRLSQSLQHDIAGVLVCAKVLDKIESQYDYNEELREKIARKYRERLQRRKQRLAQVEKEFPAFFTRFETNLFTRVSLRAAENHILSEFQQGEIGAKAHLFVERLIDGVLSDLPSITEPAPKITTGDLIGGVPLLTGLSDEVLNQLVEISKQVTFLAGDIIIGSGEHGDALYVITHGKVTVLRDGQLIAELREGDFFGEMALLGDQIRTATVKATAPCTLLRIRRKDVLSLAKANPELGNRLEKVGQERSA